MQIYRNQNSLIELRLDENSRYLQHLIGEESIELMFSSQDCIDFPPGRLRTLLRQKTHPQEGPAGAQGNCCAI